MRNEGLLRSPNSDQYVKKERQTRSAKPNPTYFNPIKED